MGPPDRPLRGHRATSLIIFGHDAEEWWSFDHSSGVVEGPFAQTQNRFAIF